MRLIAPVLCGAAHHTSQQKTASSLKFQEFLLPTSQAPNTCTTLDCSNSSLLTSRIVPLSFFIYFYLFYKRRQHCTHCAGILFNFRYCLFRNWFRSLGAC